MRRTDTPVDPAVRSDLLNSLVTAVGERRGGVFAVYGILAGLAVVAGPTVGGFLVTNFGWRWIFYVNIPIGGLALLVTLLRVDESRDPHATRPDWIGFASFSAWSPVKECITPRMGPWRPKCSRKTRSTSASASRQWITTGRPRCRPNSRWRSK